MAVNISIKNVPDALASRLRARARLNHRSLQKELIVILEAATNEDAARSTPTREPEAGAMSIEQVLERARRLFPRGTPSSTEFIRRQRDGRFGTAWVGTGRNPDER